MSRRAVDPQEMAKSIRVCASEGMTRKQTADLLGCGSMTVLRYSQKYGITFVHANKRANSTRSTRIASLNEKCLAEYGCDWERYKALKDFGSSASSNPNSYKRPIRAFDRQKRHAVERGVEWKIKLWDWWQIWLQSGKWESRGRGKDRYVMCRIGDSGAYEAGNVYIDTCSHNSSFQPNNPRRQRNNQEVVGAAA